MSSQEKVLEKKRGRPAIGKGLQFNAMLRPELAERIDAWIARQSDPRPTRPEAIRRLVEKGLVADDVSGDCAPQAPDERSAPQQGGYSATRIGPNGTVDEWQGFGKDDEDAAHRLGQHLQTKIDRRAEGYTLDDMVTLLRPDGEIVTVARIVELIERRKGWKASTIADPDLDAG